MPASDEVCVADDISIIFNQNLHHHKKRKKIRFFTYREREPLKAPCVGCNRNENQLSQPCSMPILKNHPKSTKVKIRSSDTITCKVEQPHCSRYVANLASKHRDKQYLFGRSPPQASFRVYRCQISTAEESCCCACNSDAMFDVMKSFYDCYKRKDCNHCDCILCGHLPREERLKGEMRKDFKTSAIGIGTELQESVRIIRKEKPEKIEKQLVGKTLSEKKTILKELAASGTPLPELKSSSDKELVKQVKMDMGLPPEAKTQVEKEKLKQAEAAGVLVPLEGKTQAQKKKILKKQAEIGVVLPEGRTASEKRLIDYIQSAIKEKPSEKTQTTEALRKKLSKLEVDKKLPSKGDAQLKKKIEAKEVKIPSENAIVTKEQAAVKKMPTPVVTKLDKRKEIKPSAPVSEPKLIKPISKVKAEAPPPAAKVKTKQAEIPLEAKISAEKEKMLRNLVKQQIPLPEAKTASGKKLVSKIRTDVGLPPEPKSLNIKEKYAKAQAAGIIIPLEGKTSAEKENILDKEYDAGIPLPKGRTPSEKELIKKIKASKKKSKALIKKANKLDKKSSKVMKEAKGPSDECICDILMSASKIEKKPSKISSLKDLPTPTKKLSEKLRKSKADGLMTPLEGKTPEQQEKILKGLVKHGLPLPEAKSASEKKIIQKVRTDMGLPPSDKEPVKKIKVSKKKSEALIEKAIKLDKKPPKVVKEAKGPSDISVSSKVVKEAKGPSDILVSASKIEKIPSKVSVKELPIPTKKLSEKLRKAKAAGLMTPLEGKTPEQQEKILKGLVKHGLPLPEAKSASEKKIIQKVRTDMGLPPSDKEPVTKIKVSKKKSEALIEKAIKLDKKPPKVVKEAKGPSDILVSASKIEKIPSKVSVKELPIPTKKLSEKLRKAKAAGLMTPLEGKTPEQQENILKGLVKHGLPLPEAKSASEKKIIQKVKTDMGLPPSDKELIKKMKASKKKSEALIEKAIKLDKKSSKVMKEGKGPSDECICDILASVSKIEKIPSKVLSVKDLPTPTKKLSEKIRKAKAKGPSDILVPASKIEKIPSKVLVKELPIPTKKLSEKLRKAKAAGLMTPLEGKTHEQQEKILKGLVKHGLPLPEAKSASEKKIIQKVRTDMGLPPEPKTSALRTKYARYQVYGPATPLEAQKSQRQISETEIITKTMRTKPAPKVTSEKIIEKKPKTVFEEKEEEILKYKVKKEKPLPPIKIASDKKMVDKVLSEKYAKAQAAGLVSPLERKRTPSPTGRAKVQKIKQPPVSPSISEKNRKAKAAGFAPPSLDGKSPEEMEELLKKLIKQQRPLPEAETIEEQKIVRRVRRDAGLPPEPKNYAMKQILDKAYADGIIVPLEGKSYADKEKILTKEYEAGVPLPEPRTSEEKVLIKKIKTKIPTDKQAKKIEKTSNLIKETKDLSTPDIEKLLTKVSDKEMSLATKKIRKARDSGLLVPLEGKTSEQKEKILIGLAKHGVPLPEGKTASDKKIIHKVRTDMGMPPEPKTSASKAKYARAQAAGIITPLEGKSPAQKEKILKALSEAGLPLPEARMSSEKVMITKIKTEKQATKKREKELKDLVHEAGLPLPEARKSSEKVMITKIKTEKQAIKKREKELKDLVHEAGLPLPEARKSSEKVIITKIKTEKQAAQKREKELKDLVQKGKPIPENIPPSEQKIIDKIKTDMVRPEEKPSELKEKYKKLDKSTTKIMKEAKGPSDECICGLLTPDSEKISIKPSSITDKLSIKVIDSKLPSQKEPPEKKRKVKATELVTPLAGKTPEQKEKLLIDMAKQGKPLPEVKAASDKKLLAKVRADIGLPPEPKTAASKEKYAKAQAAGIITPLEGKSLAQKEKILKALSAAGLPLPEGRMPSEKALIDKIKSERLAKKEKHKRLDQRTSKIMKEAKGRKSDDLLITESEKVISKPSSLTGKVPSKVLTSTAKLVEKRKKIKTSDLSTQLEGKSRLEKEKILKEALKQGKSLSEIKTASDKKLIDKVRSDKIKAEIEKKTDKVAEIKKKKSDETAKPKIEKLRKAKALKKPFPEKVPSARPSIVRSLTGRTPSQMEKNSKSLADARLERKATSEKYLKKVVPTKQKTRKIGEGAKAKQAAQEISAAAETKHKGGISAKFEEITKTTTCDQGCGCDTKKIRFKHSYVKIMVTSPDISSLCPCSDDCIPRAKEGVLVDNDGIKVTIGSAVGAPSYRQNQSAPEINEKYNFLKCSMSSVDFKPDNKISDVYVKREHLKCLHKRNGFYANSEESLAETFSYESDDNIWNYILSNMNKKSKISDQSNASRYLITCSEHYLTPLTISWSSVNQTDNSVNVKSSHVLLVVRTNSSISLPSKFSSGVETVSLSSFQENSIISSSCHYLSYPASNASGMHEESEYFTSTMDYNTSRRSGSEENDLHLPLSLSNMDTSTQKKSISTKKGLYDVVILRIETNLSPTNVKLDKKKVAEKADPIAVIKDVNSDLDIIKIIDKVIAKERFISKSSLLVLVPYSGENYRTISETASSSVCLRLSENIFKRSMLPLHKINDTLGQYRGLKIELKGKLFDKSALQTPTNTQATNVNSKEFCEIQCGTKDVKLFQDMVHTVSVCMDTTEDRPCCCTSEESDHSDDEDNEIYKPHASQNTTPTKKVFFEDSHLDNTTETNYYYRKHLSHGVSSADASQDTRCYLIKTDMKINFLPGDSIVSKMIAPVITDQKLDQGNNEYACCHNGPVIDVPEEVNHATRFDPPQCLVYPAKLSTRRKHSEDDSCPCAQHATKSPPADPHCATFRAPPPATLSPPPCTPHSAPPGHQQCSCTHDTLNNKMACVDARPNDPIPVACIGECTPCAPYSRHASSKPTNGNGANMNCECSCQVQTQSKSMSKAPCLPNAKNTACQSNSKDNIENMTKYPAPANTSRKTFGCQYDCGKKKSGEKGKRKRKRVQCECPPEPKPQWNFEGINFDTILSGSVSDKSFLDINFFDKGPTIKLDSDMAQMTSGFNVKFIKRPPPPPPVPVPIQEEMSFEDALAYFEEFEPDEPEEPDQEQCDIKCNMYKLRKGRVECECPPYKPEPKRYNPPQPPPPPPPPPPPGPNYDDLKGFKITLSGKGSNSKGLSDLCCTKWVRSFPTST